MSIRKLAKLYDLSFQRIQQILAKGEDRPYTRKQLEGWGQTFADIVNAAIQTDKPIFAGDYPMSDGTRRECYVISGPLGSRRIKA